MKKILFHTRQAGSASALIPVVNQLKEKGFSVLILCEAESINLWRSSGLNYIETSSFIKDVLDDYSPDFIVTGTSLKVEQDAKYWNWAHVNSIPSLAYVESWVNYKQRFTVTNDFDTLPNIIGVADELIKKRFKEEGLQKNIIKVLPQPRFDDLIKKYSKFNKVKSKKDIVIFTDPLYLGKENVKKIVGYSSNEALNGILASLSYNSIQAEHNVIIKLHPREKESDYNLKQNYKNLVVKFSKEDTYKLMFNASLVLGFTSIVLVDSSFLGIPTISYQPNRKSLVNDITDNKDNLIVVTKKKKLRESINNISQIKVSKKISNKASLEFVDFILNISNKDIYYE